MKKTSTPPVSVNSFMEGIELLDGMLPMLPNEGHLLPHLDLVPSECDLRLLAPGHQIIKPLCQQLRVLPPDEVVIDQLVNAIQPHDQLNAQCSMHEGCLLLVLLVHIDLIVGKQDMAHTLHSFPSCCLISSQVATPEPGP